MLRTANELEELYGVIVVPFSWPANGGGKVSGTAAYLSDKDDARSSATALHRAVQKVQFYHHLRNLYASNAYYIDGTRNKGVGSEHSYFKGKTVRQNSTLRRIFSRIFEGGKAEHLLTYHADINVYGS